MNKITICKSQKYKAEKIIKDNGGIRLINVIEKSENDEEISIGNLFFPGLLITSDYSFEDGYGFDLSDEDEKLLSDIELDFRLSKVELGV